MIPDTGKRLKIGELARMADVSVPTIKHYVREGLLPSPLKTGKTMAYYDEACVERILQIKGLQRDKFLPLDVIRRLLDTGTTGEEDVEMGRVLVRSHMVDPEKPPVPRSRIEERTGLSQAKIDLMEKHGLIEPARADGQKVYDAVDCEIMDLVRRREALGVSFEYSVETMGLYRDAIETAVAGDVRRFARDLLADLTAREAVRLMTEADESLDRFMVLIRQKRLSTVSRRAVQQTSALRGRLALLNFLPVPGRDLPSRAPQDPGLRVIRHLCRGEFAEVAALERDLAEVHGRPHFVAASVAARLLLGEIAEARALVDRWFPEPTARPVENCAAAIACALSAMEAAGFTDPIYYLKRAEGYLKRAASGAWERGVLGCVERYVCGALYVSLPELFDTCTAGLALLKGVAEELKAGGVKTGALPAWCRLTLAHEVLPAMEIRANRFLAEGALATGDRETAGDALARMTEIGDPEGDHARWARRELLRLMRGRKEKA